MNLLTIVFIIYAIWGWRYGWEFVDGRWEALENPKMKIIKVIAAFYIGVVVGVFKLIEHIFRLFGI